MVASASTLRPLKCPSLTFWLVAIFWLVSGSGKPRALAAWRISWDIQIGLDSFGSGVHNEASPSPLLGLGSFLKIFGDVDNEPPGGLRLRNPERPGLVKVGQKQSV